MTTTLVTGGAGFIGSHLCERLTGAEERVVCLDNFNDFYAPALKRRNVAQFVGNGAFTLIEGDIRDAKLIDGLFLQHKFDRVVHLAAMAGVRPSLQQPHLYYDVNCLGTLTLLEACKKFSVETFIFGSSSSVYGGSRMVPFKEDQPINAPVSPYAATKHAGELMCYTYHHLYGIAITCLRFFTVYGPRQRPEMAIAKFTRLIDTGQEVPVYGDGSSRRDYTYIDDILQGILASLEKAHPFEVFNLGESQTITLQKLVEQISDALGKPANIARKPDQPGDVPITYADVTKARELLGYSPKVKIEEGIQRYVEWYRRHAGEAD